MWDQLFTQLQTTLTPILLAAATAFLAWLFNELRTVFHINASDSAEAAIRTAAATAAGKLAATVPQASSAALTASPTTSVASLFSTDQLQAAAGKIVSDLPNEVKRTGYTPTDIMDMILGNLPSILGALNPALGAAAAVVKDIAGKA